MPAAKIKAWIAIDHNKKWVQRKVRQAVEDMIWALLLSQRPVEDLMEWSSVVWKRVDSGWTHWILVVVGQLYYIWRVKPQLSINIKWSKLSIINSVGLGFNCILYDTVARPKILADWGMALIKHIERRTRRIPCNGGYFSWSPTEY